MNKICFIILTILLAGCNTNTENYDNSVRQSIVNEILLPHMVISEMQYNLKISLSDALNKGVTKKEYSNMVTLMKNVNANLLEAVNRGDSVIFF